MDADDWFALHSSVCPTATVRIRTHEGRIYLECGTCCAKPPGEPGPKLDSEGDADTCPIPPVTAEDGFHRRRAAQELGLELKLEPQKEKTKPNRYKRR